jgi:hypothetical protein
MRKGFVAVKVLLQLTILQLQTPPIEPGKFLAEPAFFLSNKVLFREHHALLQNSRFALANRYKR